MRRSRRRRKEKEKGMRRGWHYKRGDVYAAELNSGNGSVQGGKRPVIVVQNDEGNYFSPTLIVVPVTSELKKLSLPTHFIIKNVRRLIKISMGESEQTTTINKTQITRYLGKLDEKQMRIVDDCLRKAMDLDEEAAIPGSYVEFP